MKYVVTADIHMRSDVPICRMESQEEWMQVQYKALCEIVDIANTHEADIIIAGDLTDVPRVPAEMITMFIEAMYPLLGSVHIIGGNHSLSNHREGCINRSSIGILKAMAGDNTGKIRYHVCEEESINGRFEHSYRLNDDVTLVHTLVFKDEESLPFAYEAITADDLLEKYDTPWIFTGDMHQAFDHEKDNRHVINAGCLVAQTVKEKDYDIGCWLVDTGTKIDVSVMTDKRPMYRITDSSIKRIPITHDPAMISTEHITRKRDKDDTLSSMIEAFEKSGEELSLDFVLNLLDYMLKNVVSLGAREIVDEIKEEKV